MSKRYFPLFVDLSDKKVVVVGGGNVATRRVQTLLHFTRNVKVVAPQMSKELVEMGKAGQIEAVQRPVKRIDLGDAYMVIAATNDWKLNDEIYRIYKAQGVYTNVVSDREKCDFYFPGVYIQDELVIGVTASGLDHKKAARVRQGIESVLVQEAERKQDD